MAQIELKVEIDDQGLFAALAEVENAQRLLDHAIAKLNSRMTGRFADIMPNAAEVKEKSPAQ